MQARLVASATGSLCEAAHATVQGDYSEKKLINSAKDVADSTEKLLVACRTHGDQNSKMQQGLQVCMFNNFKHTDKVIIALYKILTECVEELTGENKEKRNQNIKIEHTEKMTSLFFY